MPEIGQDRLDELLGAEAALRAFLEKESALMEAMRRADEEAPLRDDETRLREAIEDATMMLAAALTPHCVTEGIDPDKVPGAMYRGARWAYFLLLLAPEVTADPDLSPEGMDEGLERLLGGQGSLPPLPELGADDA